MQGISVYARQIASDDKLMYHCFHERNGEYLERENDVEIFKVLKDVDDCDPSGFYTAETLEMLISDIIICIGEADEKRDNQLSNHLREILVLCKLCLWSIDQLYMIISPYEYVPENLYPSSLPDHIKKNISQI